MIARTKPAVGYIRDAEQQGDFKPILCWDQDRFGRFDSIEAGEWISRLRRVGVELAVLARQNSARRSNGWPRTTGRPRWLPGCVERNLVGTTQRPE